LNLADCVAARVAFDKGVRNSPVFRKTNNSDPDPHSRYLYDGRPVIAPNQSFSWAIDVIGTVKASDPGNTLSDGQIKDGTGAYRFSIRSTSGEITAADDSDGRGTPWSSWSETENLPSHNQTVTINLPKNGEDDSDSPTRCFHSRHQQRE